jgi:predicted phosphodiesterase
VLGNCDVPLPGLDIPALARLTVAGVRILVIHDRADLGAIPPDVDVVVRGHSHIPSAVWEEGVLIANPGSASQRRSQPGCTVGVLQIAADGRLSARTIELDDFGERVR